MKKKLNLKNTTKVINRNDFKEEETKKYIYENKNSFIDIEFLKEK